jgi:UDP-3-O-[3-hydroxymyristoyl] N-acetylglucosamine deacetylase
MSGDANAGIHNPQRTLRWPIQYVGLGLHSGRRVSMSLKPAGPDTGIAFLRKDVPAGTGWIPARWYHAAESELCTVLLNDQGVQVGTVEHLLAALRGCGVDNALIELDGPEVPIMDGSSEPFVSLIERMDTVTQPAARHAIWVQRPVELRQGEAYAILMPSRAPRITVSIDFADTAIGAQTLSVELVDEAFRRDVARARTFGFAHQLAELRSRGLARGGSLRNAVLVDGDRIVNREGLRYQDEFVRHKILDAYGDLSLAGVTVLGHYYAHRPGHALNQALVRALFHERGSWSYLSLDEFHDLMGARGEDDRREADHCADAPGRGLV